MGHALTWHLPSSLSPRLTGAVRRLWSAYWARRRERATVVILNSLDDRVLKDLAIDRSEIESVARNTGHDRRIGP
jgi:uncharacterized protein YjiS (DUF1127 family)